ncbi:Fis family transcriptional regulator, partial [candidate division TA06 bacterium]
MKKSEYEIILNSIAEGVFVVDLDRAIVYINDAAKKLVGVEENDVIGKRCYEVFKSSVCEKQCLLKRLIKEGKSIFDEEVEITDLFGEKIDVLVSAVPITDKSGEIVGAVETIRDISIVKELDKEIREKYTFQDIVSKNKRILEIFKILPDIAKSDSTVLISGENGTGKELFANAIHNLSYRKDKPFVKINCGALPDNLLESELFGYKKGAFTGAVKDKPGRVETAEGGTIFL